MGMTPDDIQKALIFRRDEFFAKCKEEQAEDESFYEDTFNIGIKPPFHAIRTGAGRLHVDTACDQINYSNPVATRQPRSQSNSERELQDNVEKWLNGWFSHLMQQEPNPIRESIKNAAIFGEVFGQLILDESADFPFKVQVYDPQVIFPNPTVTIGNLDNIIVYHQRSMVDIAGQYPDWPKLKKVGSDTGMVDWLEYHAPNELYCEAGGNAVTKGGGIAKTGIPFLPWVHSYAGYGRFSGAGAPETLSVGLLRGMRGSIKSDAWIMSLIDSIVSLWTFPRVWTTDTDNEVDFDLAPGKVIRMPPNVYDKTKVDTGVQPDPALFQYAAMLGSRLNSWSPSTLRGEPSPSVESGYGQAVVGGYARLRFGTLLTATQRFWSKMAAHALRMVDQVLEVPVPIWTDYGEKGVRQEVTLKPDMIQNYYLVNVKLEAADPEARQRRMIMGADLWGKGAISKRYMLEEFAGVPNAMDMMAEIMAERLVETSPQLQQMMAQKALEQVGLADEVERMKEQEAQAQQMQVGLQQVMQEPQIPNVPPRPALPGSYEAARQVLANMKRGPSPSQASNNMGGGGMNAPQMGAGNR